MSKARMNEVISPELLEQEKKKIIDRVSRQNPNAKATDFNNEKIYDIIK
jgi:hypothetical protein